MAKNIGGVACNAIEIDIDNASRKLNLKELILTKLPTQTQIPSS
jgi:hypothetical protein